MNVLNRNPWINQPCDWDKVLLLSNETAAAAIAYSFDNKVNKRKLYLRFRLQKSPFQQHWWLYIDSGTVEVRSTAVQILGGEDFDNNLLQYFVKDFDRKQKRDISSRNNYTLI